MATKWGVARWGTFRWGGSVEFSALLDRKDGVHPRRRITLKLDSGDVDLTPYLISASAVYQEKERAPDRMAAGDATMVFSNYNGAFTETNTSSLLYNKKYHNRNIVFELGIELASGTVEYIKVSTMKIRSVSFSVNNSRVTFRVYDQVRRLLTETLNRRPDTMIPVAGAANVGNGKCSEIDIRPFVNVAQSWTLTCTLGGGDSTATFSVVGSVSGNIGTATSGTEFLNATTGGIKFTINTGATVWSLNDAFTFSTVKMMEFNVVNPVKILWSILTGTNFDTGAAEAWQDRTPQLNSTRNSSNPDLLYDAFSIAATNLTFTMKGFVPWDSDLVKIAENIVLHFLGSLNVDGVGRLYVKSFKPGLADTPSRTFSDVKKNITMSLTRDLNDMVNWVNFRYRKKDIWPWDDDEGDSLLDGLLIQKSQTSFDDYDQWFTLNLKSFWYHASAAHVSFAAQRIVDKYGTPPNVFRARTGLDGIDVEIGDIVSVTDAKLGYTDYQVEVVKKEGAYEKPPILVDLALDDTLTAGFTWAFLGSLSNEGDGLSPQAATWDTATTANKLFCYIGQTAGGAGTPLFYLF